jgi:hypothetical protein
MDKIIHELGFSVARVTTHQVRAPKLVVAVDEHYRSTQFGSNVKCQSGLSRSRGSGKVHGIPHCQVCGSSIREVSDVRGTDKLFTGLGNYVIAVWPDRFRYRYCDVRFVATHGYSFPSDGVLSSAIDRPEGFKEQVDVRGAAGLPIEAEVTCLY